MSENAPRRRRIRVTYALFYMAFLYLPIVILPVFSFNDSIYISFPLKGFTLEWYAGLAGNDSLFQALLNSLTVASISALCATTLGVFAARAVTRYRVRGGRSILAMIMLPIVVPELILAIALLIALNYTGLGLGLGGVILGHVLLCVPFATAVLIPRFEGCDVTLEEAARDLGESAWMTFWRVIFPLILPGVIASALLTFTISFDEFLIAFFLSSTEQTLPVYIWGQLRFPQKLPGVLALGSIIIAVSFVLVILAEWARRGDAPLSTNAPRTGGHDA